MEQNLSALLFPDTEPFPHDIRKLLFFFNSLSYYQPTEEKTVSFPKQDFPENLCTAYVPAPLLEDLDRFNRLMRELENSRSEDLGRLFSTAKSPIDSSLRKDRDETSSTSVLSAMHSDSDENKQISQKERLWQARLILKLAEMLDRRENEIRQGLAKISTAEQKVLASLEGLNLSEAGELVDDPDLAIRPLKKRIVTYPGNYQISGAATLLPLRIKSWTELFLADSSPNRPFLLATTDQDSGSIILDRCESHRDIQPQKLLTLTVPAFPAPGDHEASAKKYLACRDEFRASVRDSLDNFAAFLTETAVSDSYPAKKSVARYNPAEHVTTWEETVRKSFPISESGSQKLVIYCFPGVPLDALLQKLFKLEPPIAAGGRIYSTGLLALLHT